MNPGDEEVVTRIALAIAAALDAGWTSEETQDLVEAMWPDMVKFKAKHIVECAIAEAKKDSTY